MRRDILLCSALLGLALQGCGDAVTAPILTQPEDHWSAVPGAPAGYPVPAAIAADCSADVTQALQEWIASVPDHSTLIFQAGACYNIDGGLLIDDRHGLVFEGNGATFRVFSRGAPERSNWIFRGGSNLTLREITVVGANPHAGTSEAAYDPAVEWQHGFRLRGVQGALLERLKAYDVYGDFINLSHDGRVARPGPPNRDITIRQGHFERNGRMGISITHGERIWIQDNYLGGVRMFGVDLELNDDREVGRDLYVERNTFGPSYQGFFAAMGHGTAGSVGKVYIRNNTTTRDHPARCDETRIAIGGPAWAGRRPAERMWSNFVIEDNLIHAPRRGRAARIAAVKNVELRGNTIIGLEAPAACGPEGPLDLRDAHEVRITGNTIRGEATPMWTKTYVADALSTGVTESGNVLELIAARNQVPLASFRYRCVAAGCSFADHGADPDGRIVAWDWSFGNGSTSSAQNPSQIYRAAGTYTVRQRVTDDRGATSSTSRTITCRQRLLALRCG